MDGHKKALNLPYAMAITMLTLTLGIQGYCMAMTAPSHDIVAGTPEPITKKATDTPSEEESVPTQIEDKAPCSDKTAKKSEEGSDL